MSNGRSIEDDPMQALTMRCLLRSSRWWQGRAFAEAKAADTRAIRSHAPTHARCRRAQSLVQPFQSKGEVRDMDSVLSIAAAAMKAPRSGSR